MLSLRSHSEQAVHNGDRQSKAVAPVPCQSLEPAKGVVEVTVTEGHCIVWNGSTWIPAKVKKSWKAGGVRFYRVSTGNMELTVREKDIR